MACVWKRPRLHSVNVLSHYRAREKRHATSSFKISSEQNRALQVRLLSKKAKIAMATLTSKTVTILNLMHHIVCPVHVHIRKSHYKIGIVSFANSKKWCFPKLLKLSFDWLLVTFQCWTACSLHCFGCATQYTRPLRIDHKDIHNIWISDFFSGWLVLFLYQKHIQQRFFWKSQNCRQKYFMQ